jgi:hypothetical protein
MYLLPIVETLLRLLAGYVILPVAIAMLALEQQGGIRLRDDPS